MARFLSTLTILALAGVLAGGASPASPPTSLVASLRTAGYPDAALPGGFSSASTVRPALAAHSRVNGAIGEVEIDVDGPDPAAGIVFVVFRTAAGAHADLAGVPLAPDGLSVSAAGKIAGYAASAMFRGTITQTNALANTTVDSATFAIVQQGNVIVAGFTYALAQKGNGYGALMLMRSGINHLAKASTHA